MNGPGPGEAIGFLGGFLCALLIILPLAVAIGAVIFRAACSLYNKLSQPENHVPEASFGKSMLIVFVSAILQNVAAFPIGLVIGVIGGAARMQPQLIQIIAGIASLPVGLVVSAAIVMWLLPTTFGRALLVSLIQFAIGLAIGIMIFAIVLVVLLAVGGMR